MIFFSSAEWNSFIIIMCFFYFKNHFVVSISFIVKPFQTLHCSKLQTNLALKIRRNITIVPHHCDPLKLLRKKCDFYDLWHRSCHLFECFACRRAEYDIVEWSRPINNKLNIRWFRWGAIYEWMNWFQITSNICFSSWKSLTIKWISFTFSNSSQIICSVAMSSRKFELLQMM